MPLGATRRIQPVENRHQQQNQTRRQRLPLRERQPSTWRYGRRSLLDSSLCAGGLEFRLDGLGIRLRNAFLDGGRRALDKVLRLLEPQTGDFPYDLDDAHFVGAELGQGHGEFGLHLRRRRRSRRTARRTRLNRSRRRDVDLLFHGGNQFDHVHDRHLGNRIENFVFSNSHFALQKTLKGLSTRIRINSPQPALHRSSWLQEQQQASVPISNWGPPTYQRTSKSAP